MKRVYHIETGGDRGFIFSLNDIDDITSIVFKLEADENFKLKIKFEAILLWESLLIKQLVINLKLYYDRI